MFGTLLFLLGLVSSCSPRVTDPAKLNLIFIGSSPEGSSSYGEEKGSSNGVWPAVQLAVEHVNQLEGMLEGYDLTVSTSKMLQENSSVMLNGVSVTCKTLASIFLVIGDTYKKNCVVAANLRSYT